MWSNGIKCKYLFTFSLKNLARKGLMARCCQAPSHYLSQCWPRCMSSLYYSITGPQWVNSHLCPSSSSSWRLAVLDAGTTKSEWVCWWQCHWWSKLWLPENKMIQSGHNLFQNGTINRTSHLSSHYWNYYPGALLIFKSSHATYLNIGHP